MSLCGRFAPLGDVCEHFVFNALTNLDGRPDQPAWDYVHQQFNLDLYNAVSGGASHVTKVETILTANLTYADGAVFARSEQVKQSVADQISAYLRQHGYRL